MTVPPSSVLRSLFSIVGRFPLPSSLPPSFVAFAFYDINQMDRMGGRGAREGGRPKGGQSQSGRRENGQWTSREARRRGRASSLCSSSSSSLGQKVAPISKEGRNHFAPMFSPRQFSLHAGCPVPVGISAVRGVHFLWHMHIRGKRRLSNEELRDLKKNSSKPSACSSPFPIVILLQTGSSQLPDNEIAVGCQPSSTTFRRPRATTL